MTATTGPPLSGSAGRVAVLAVVASVAYFVSDAIEVAQGGFSTGQLWLTLVAGAAVPVMVVGLYRVQRPAIGRLGRLSAAAYAYSFVFFTGTAVLALVNDTADFDALRDDLGAVMVFHGAVMVAAGVGLGAAVSAAGVLPRWTGVALIVAMALIAVSQGGGEVVRLASMGGRDFAFAAMGVELLRTGRRPASRPRLVEHHGSLVR